jgi:flagellar biosynthesis/type III secretory pathway M-ring protein FliF/YscJ
LDRKTLLVGGGAAVGALVIGFLFAWLLRRKRTASVEVTGAAALPPGDSPAARAALAAANAEHELEEQIAEREALQQKADAQALGNLKLAPVITKKAEVLAKHLREKIAKEPEVSAQILRTWIREEES